MTEQTSPWKKISTEKTNQLDYIKGRRGHKKTKARKLVKDRILEPTIDLN